MELLAWTRGMAADRGQLDILVEDIFCRQAMVVNGRGTRAQLSFLRRHYTEKEIKALIRHEMQLLREHAMVMQSKIVPENNIRARRTKKKKRRRT